MHNIILLICAKSYVWYLCVIGYVFLFLKHLWIRDGISLIVLMWYPRRKSDWQRKTCPTASVLKTLHLGRSRLFCSRHWDWLQYSRFYQMSTSNMGYGRTRAFPIDCKILLSKCCRRSHCLWYHFKTFIRKW